MKQIAKNVNAIIEALRDGMKVTDRSGHFEVKETRKGCLCVVNNNKCKVHFIGRSENIPMLMCFYGGVYASNSTGRV